MNQIEWLSRRLSKTVFDGKQSFEKHLIEHSGDPLGMMATDRLAVIACIIEVTEHVSGRLNLILLGGLNDVPEGKREITALRRLREFIGEKLYEEFHEDVEQMSPRRTRWYLFMKEERRRQYQKIVDEVEKLIQRVDQKGESE